MAIKNSYFGKLDFESLSKEEKVKAFPLQLFLTAKQKGDIKSQRMFDRSIQKIHTDKQECTQLILDFCAFKYICTIIS